MQRHRAILWPLVVAAVVRIVWALYAARAEPEFFTSGDQHSYWALGESIGSGDGYQIPEWGVSTSYYPVGWPAILGLAAAIRLNTPLPDTAIYSTAIIQIAFGLLTVFCAWVIARRISNERVAVVAAWIVALFPNLIFAVATYSVETSFVALTVATVAIAVSHDWSAGPPSTWRLVAIGATLAASILVRPFAAPLILGLVIAAIAARYPWRAVLKVVLVPVVVVLVSLIPWTVRNAQTFDAFIPISTNLGDTVCIDRVSWANGTFRWSTHEGCADPDLPEVERNPKNTRKAIEFVIENPAKEVQLWGMRLFRMMQNDRSSLEEVRTLSADGFRPDPVWRGLGLLADAYFFTVGALSIVGIAMVRRGLWRGPERIITFTTAAFLLIIPMLLWGATRFHTPLEPFMAIIAAVPLVAWWSRRSPEPEEAPAPVAQSTS